jgi:hypothetical protein
MRDRAGSLSCADHHVLRPGREVDEVPLTENALDAVDDEDAFTREHQEVLLLVLAVVHGVRLPRLEHVNIDAVPREARVALEPAVATQLVVACPGSVAGIDHEPTLSLGDKAGRRVGERGFSHLGGSTET